MVPHGPSTLPPCDRISEQIHLLVDRELGPAEEAVVESHLQACPRCQALAARIERMSSVLKGWDARTNDHPTPDRRLHNAVLARVAAQSAHRRREDRLLGLIQFATAAAVLIAVGLAVLLGLSAGSAPAGSAPTLSTTTAADGHAAGPAAKRLDAGFGFEPLPLASSLSALDVDSGVTAPRIPPSSAPQPADWDRAVELDRASVERLAFFVARLDTLDAFSERVGRAGTRVYVPGERRDRPWAILTVDAYRYLHERGILAEWSRATTPVSPTVEPGSTPLAERRDTGVEARDMLAPFPASAADAKALRSRPQLSRWGTKSDERRRVEAWSLRPGPQGARLRSSPLGSGASAFLDPLVAEANGWLRLVDSPSGAHVVVALVKGAAQPILLPAGQFLTGGVADRVLAEPVWLPPSQEERPYILPCRVVQNTPDRHATDAPRVTEWIAGPTIRALLAAGASQEDVKAAARRQVAARLTDPSRMEFWADWSLLDLYDGEQGRSLLERVRSTTRWAGEEGFVAADAQGRFLGLEIVRLPGPASAELLSRLWTGYVVELRLGVRPTRPAGSAPAVAPPGEDMAAALVRLAACEEHFQLSLGIEQREGVRVSTLDFVPAGVHLHALEVGERPAVVSALR